MSKQEEFPLVRPEDRLTIDVRILDVVQNDLLMINAWAAQKRLKYTQRSKARHNPDDSHSPHILSTFVIKISENYADEVASMLEKLPYHTDIWIGYFTENDAAGFSLPFWVVEMAYRIKSEIQVGVYFEGS